MKRFLDIEFPPRRILFLMTILCIGMMIVTYFSSDTSIPIRTAVGYVVVPLQKGINQAGGLIYDAADKRITMNQLLDDNEALKQENDQLRQQLALTENDRLELYRLRSMLEMKESFPEYEMTGAKIISRNSENWYQKFTIDKGTNDGINVNMVVVSGNGLVGIVTAVGGNYATVTSIIDDAMNVSAMSVSTSATCIVRGDAANLNEGRIQILYINKDDTINEGDAIVTSHISDYYLPDILVGYATDISMDSNMLTQSGSLIPAVDFSNLEEVMVITTLKESGE